VLAFAMVLVFGSLMTSAILHGLLVSGQSHLDQIDRDIDVKQRELDREKLELANLQSPARIVAEATDAGLIPAPEQHWLSPGTGAPPVVTGGADPTDPATTDPTVTGSELAADDPGAAGVPAQ